MFAALNDEQSALQREARRVLRGGAGLADETGPGWPEIAALGWPAIAIPEDLGGAGYDLMELALVVEELGGALSGLPLVDTWLVTHVVARSPGMGDLTQLLLSGETTAATDVAGLATALTGGQPAVSVHGERLWGSTVLLLPEGATHLLLVARGGNSDQPRLVLADAASSAVKTRPDLADDLRRTRVVLDLDGAPATVLDVDVEAVAATALTLLSFDQLGVAQRALDTTVAYAKQRQQFGRPIGSFQAVKHRLADMLTAVELARSTCWFAAAQGSNADDPRPALQAFLSSCEAAAFVTREAIQLHGGFGYAWESGLHLPFRRAKATAMLPGGHDALREALFAAHLTRPAWTPDASTSAEAVRA